MSIVYDLSTHPMLKKAFIEVDDEGKEFQGPINPIGLLQAKRNKPRYLGPGNRMPPISEKTGLPSFEGHPEYYPTSVPDLIAFHHDVAYGSASKASASGQHHVAKFMQRQADLNMVNDLQSYAHESGLDKHWGPKRCWYEPQYCVGLVGIKSKMVVEDGIQNVKNAMMAKTALFPRFKHGW